ncbi:MAG: TIGR03905 family TSCPD domain-containing protein [Bacteroidales bacterium]|nr:TIGR03905 family TSCPD domain-containing protein [Bacteroidales bacterium]
MIGDDFRILSDKTNAEGVRHITAEPSQLVCSNQIDFDIVDGKLHNVKYIRGCEGNLRAIGRLLEGLEPQKAVDILTGVDCHGRGTSCSDQLTRVLKAVL